MQTQLIIVQNLHSAITQLCTTMYFAGIWAVKADLIDEFLYSTATNYRIELHHKPPARDRCMRNTSK